LVAAFTAAAWAASGAFASATLPDRDVVNTTLKVNAGGVALLQYTTTAGLRRNVLFWGAVNAVPNPTLGATQQAFKIDYTGGWKSRHNGKYWRTFRNACKPYAGPRLPFFVAGCTALDGSHWALQSWQPNLPMRGFDPWKPIQRSYELSISHWSGDLPVLETYQHWTYANAQQGFFGRLTYQGQPVYGTRTVSPTVSDPFSRNLYIDAFNSDYGPGWKHDTAIAIDKGDGGYCYTFVPQPPPAGYPSTEPNGNGLGEQFRITAIGPGVTPIVQWVGSRLDRIDPAAQVSATAAFDRILGRDAHCAPER
jgi:hypothetical protein